MHERLGAIIRSILGVIGIAYAVANWREARADQQALQSLSDYPDDGPRARIARSAVRREQLRCLAHVLFFAPGAFSVIDPPPTSAPHRWQVLTLLSMVGGQGVIVLNTILDHMDREKVESSLKSDIVAAMTLNTAAILADTAQTRETMHAETAATTKNTAATESNTAATEAATEAASKELR